VIIILNKALEKSKYSKPNHTENKQSILQFYEFMKRAGTSERYQNNNLKAITAYSKLLGPSYRKRKLRFAVFGTNC
jgi:hypothetical protein